MTLSPAREADVPELVALINSAYRGESSRAGWTTEAGLLDGQRTDPEGIREHILHPKHVILCLREQAGGPIVGSVLLERIERPEGNGAYLGMLTVKPTLQAKGIGRRILEGAEAFARTEWNARRVILGVIQLRTELIAWYERRGYRRTGETLPFPYHDPRAGLPKREDLHFIMFEKSLG